MRILCCRRQWYVVTLAALAVCVAAPASALAEPVCTDSWTGASSGEWQEASNWSSKAVPTSSDVACLGEGTSVEATGSAEAGVILDKGTLIESGTSLAVTSALEGSHIATLRVASGSFTSTGTVDVSASLMAESGGTLGGTGPTVVESGATGELTGHISSHTLLNDGSLSVSKSRLTLTGSAELENVGTLHVDYPARNAVVVEGTASVVNKGRIVKDEGSGASGIEGGSLTNDGTIEVQTSSFGVAGTVTSPSGSSWAASSGANLDLEKGEFTMTEATWKGTVHVFSAATVMSTNLLGEGATVDLEGGGTWSVGGTTTVAGLESPSGVLTGAGTLKVSGVFHWTPSSGGMEGSGKTIVEASATGTIAGNITERTVVNEGELAMTSSQLDMRAKALFENRGVFTSNLEHEWAIGISPSGKDESHGFWNYGYFERTKGSGSASVGVEVTFHNYGVIDEPNEEHFHFFRLLEFGRHAWGCDKENPSFPKREYAEEEGVCTASGDFTESQTDLSIGGRGVGLAVARTYNSQAAEDGYKSTFGYGWTSPYSEHLTFRSEATETESELEAPPEAHYITLQQENGSTVEFYEGEHGTWVGPPGSPDVLTGTEGSGYTLTLESQVLYKFSGTTGRLESITDRFGNKTTLAYNEAGQLTTVTDPAGRHLTFTYTAGGLIKTVEDPRKEIVEYGYEESEGRDNLISVTAPGESALRWQFKYEGTHQLHEMLDGRSGKTTITYDSNHRVTSKVDPMNRETRFTYGGAFANITNESTKAETRQFTTSQGQLAKIVHGAGTTAATTESFTYDAAGDKLTATDGDGHITHYEYDSHGNKILEEDPEGHKKRWTYDSTHDIETETTPSGETTTYHREADGNPTTVERPAPHSETQTTKYTYNANGQVETMTDPLKRVTTYGYDSYGDKNEEVNPAKDKRTWEYNADSQEIKMISPRGYETKKEANYTTTTERDPQGRPTKVTEPLTRETKYVYDADGNLEKRTDPLGHETVYTYDADNERTKVKEPNGTETETSYDGAGQIESQTDGRKHTTKYVRNVLEQVTEIVDPLNRKTTKEYDNAGNLTKLTDPEKQTTTYEYDKDNRPKKITYSDGKTHSVEYEYDEDGARKKMIDGTGSTTYEHDQLDRLTETTDGHGDVVKYEYDLANEPTKITYPNTKAVTQEYDEAGRLKSVTDWLEHTTKFAYDADGDLKTITYPSATSNEDKYTYDETDATKEVKMLKGTETLASLVYTRNKDGQVEKVTSKGLPGEEKPAFTYDANSRLKEGAKIAYEYDEANNPKKIGTLTYSYDNADEIEKAKEGETTKATYAYDEDGQRTKLSPTSGPATTYGYDQAGNLISVERPKEGATSEIKDSYGSNGDGLRASQTIAGTTTYLAWDLAEKLPLILNDGTNSYVYGPQGLPFEQISAGETPTYLHHDQQGSTRLLTGASGTKEGATTYDAYGNILKSEGAATTPLGYDGQYTSADTGLIYLRARTYDPVTDAFLSVDPALTETLAPYNYAEDDPLALADPSGECTATAAAINGPHSLATPAECRKKLSAVRRITSKVTQRLKDLAKDERELGPAEIETHVQSLNEASRALEKIISAFKSRGCEETLNVRIPAEVVELARLRWRVEVKPVA